MPGATFPRFDPQPACLFDAALLNFALHVRMGDRRLIQAAPDSYFDMLEDLMGNITDSVLKRRLAPPLFHVFTETLRPCPSEETGVFDEFPTWPVELSQVRRTTFFTAIIANVQYSVLSR